MWSYIVSYFEYEWRGSYVDYGHEAPPDYPELEAGATVELLEDGVKRYEIELYAEWFLSVCDEYDEKERALREVEFRAQEAVQALESDEIESSVDEELADIFNVRNDKGFVKKTASVKTADNMSKFMKNYFSIMNKYVMKNKKDWRQQLKELRRKNEKNTRKYKSKKLDDAGFVEQDINGEKRFATLKEVNGQNILHVIEDGGQDGMCILQYAIGENGEPDFSKPLAQSLPMTVDEIAAKVNRPGGIDYLSGEELATMMADNGASRDEIKGFVGAYKIDDETLDGIIAESRGEEPSKQEEQVDESESDGADEEQQAEPSTPKKEDKPNTCKGKCDDGTPCNNPVSDGEEYCYLHGGGKTSMLDEMIAMAMECRPKTAGKCYKVEFEYYTGDSIGYGDIGYGGSEYEKRHTCVLVDANDEEEAKVKVDAYGHDMYGDDYIGLTNQNFAEFDSYEDYQNQYPYSSYERVAASTTFKDWNVYKVVDGVGYDEFGEMQLRGYDGYYVIGYDADGYSSEWGPYSSEDEAIRVHDIPKDGVVYSNLKTAQIKWQYDMFGNKKEGVGDDGLYFYIVHDGPMTGYEAQVVESSDGIGAVSDSHRYRSIDEAAAACEYYNLFHEFNAIYPEVVRYEASQKNAEFSWEYGIGGTYHGISDDGKRAEVLCMNSSGGINYDSYLWRVYEDSDARWRGDAIASGECDTLEGAIAECNSRVASKKVAGAHGYIVEYGFKTGYESDFGAYEVIYAHLIVEAMTRDEAKEKAVAYCERIYGRSFVHVQVQQQVFDIDAFYEEYPLCDYTRIARGANNYATAPRIPDDINTDSENADACPLCGDPNFDGEFCNVCGYEEPPEGFGDIEIESPADYEAYESEAEEDSEPKRPEFDPDDVRLDNLLEQKADELAENVEYEEPTDDEMAFA